MKTRMRHDERRAAIVASAIHIFAEKGFRGTTTRELAASLGVTEPVLYQHFETKNGIYEAIIEAKIAEGSKRIADLEKSVQSADDRAVFTQIAGMILDRYDRDPDFIRLLLFSALERHEVGQQFFGTVVTRFYGIVSGYIRKRIRAGAFRKVNAAIAARCFIGMVQEHGLIPALFGSRSPAVGRKKLIDEIVSVFLDGISIHPEGETT